MHIKSIVSDEDREELERMLSLGFIIPNQLFKTRQKSRMIIYIFTPVEFLLSINCYLSESYLMFGIGIGTCVACVAWIIWYQMIGKILKKMFMNLSGVDQDMKRWISMKTQLK